MAGKQSDQQLLISKRLNTVAFGGFWEFPGGKIEADETAQECVVRELQEELGLTIEVGQALPVLEHYYNHGHIRLYPFFCKHRAGKPRNLQVAEHRWVRPSELSDYRMPPANEPLITQILSMLTKAQTHCADKPKSPSSL